MASFRERPREQRETLVYETPEQGAELRETLERRLQRESSDGQRDREVVQEVAGDVLAAEGAAVRVRSVPWEHTEAEHQEAQALVDIAFEKDLGAALAAARKSKHYPRILDLFHDVLTGELYDLVREQRLNRQPLTGWVLLLVTFLIIVGSLIGVLIFV